MSGYLLGDHLDQSRSAMCQHREDEEHMDESFFLFNPQLKLVIGNSFSKTQNLMILVSESFVKSSSHFMDFVCIKIAIA